MSLIPVILSGGAGTRLWPVSRELHPKPFIRLADGASLLQKAFKRASGLRNVSEILTVTNRELYFKTADEYAELGDAVAPLRFILEPEGRNTAPAIAAAALDAASRWPDDTIMLFLTADHLIDNVSAFGAAVDQASALAETGSIVTFGIQPASPETGYGYIQAEGNKVVAFVEKPDLETARQYVSSGEYLWNSGMFCAQIKVLLEQFAIHAPGVLENARAALGKGRELTGPKASQVELDAAAFGAIENISVDYAIMEKTTTAAVVPCDIGWSDIGSWDALGAIGEQDADQNSCDGEVLMHDTHGCYIRSGGRLIATVGVDNLVVIDTPDALLVADRSRSQEVKQIVQQLKASNHDAYKLHTTVHRPWGTYTVLEDAENYKIKRIMVKQGAALSLQMHHHRSEHWIVVSGTARVVNGENELLVATNESTYIPAGHKHRLENPGKLDLVMIEVQSGAYLGEDDIVRFDDVYGRV